MSSKFNGEPFNVYLLFVYRLPRDLNLNGLNHLFLCLETVFKLNG